MLQVLARSATGERMNPYTSALDRRHPRRWAAEFPRCAARQRPLVDSRAIIPSARPCDASAAPPARIPVPSTAKPAAMPTVRSMADPSAPSSLRSLMHMEHAQSLPYASSLCGACYEVCPVKINIPEVLIDLRAQVVDQERKRDRTRLRPDVPRACASPTSSSPAPGVSAGLNASAASPFVPSPAKTAGFTHCRASARRWTMTRDLRGYPDRPSATGGRARPKDKAMSDARQTDSRSYPRAQSGGSPSQPYADLPRDYIHHGELDTCTPALD